MSDEWRMVRPSTLAELRAENESLLESWRRLDVTHRMAVEENERLRAALETVVAMCVPMDPPASNPVDPIIAKVLHDIARNALAPAVSTEPRGDTQ